MDQGDKVFPQEPPAALVVLEFPSFRDFIDAYSPIISEDGIFIRDADVAKSNAFAVGDQINFEVRLKDDFRLIQGNGEVVRLGTEEAAGGASGAAVRFREIDEPSQRLISRLVDNYVRDGGKLFAVGATGEGESQLTAETLKASEAEALFASEDDEEVRPPVEVESLSPADAGAGAPPAVSTSDADSAALRDQDAILDGPVGLETIAIPAGLISMEPEKESAIDEAAPAQRADELAENLAEDLGEGPVSESDADLLEPDSSLEPLDEALDSLDLPSLDAVAGDGDEGPTIESPAGAEAVLAAAHGEVDSFDPVASLSESPLEVEGAEVLDLGADEPPLEAAADALDSKLGARVGIPDEIAQVAEELSGVHHVDAAPDQEYSGTTYAGSASAKSETNVGGRIAALVVIATLLGATAYYFGDTIRGWFGSSGADPGLVDAGESFAEARGPAVGATPDAAEGSSDSTPSDAVAAEDAGEDAEGAGAAAEAFTAGAPAAVTPAAADADTDPDSAQGTADRITAAAAPGDDASDVPPSVTSAETTRATTRSVPVVAGARAVERISWRREGDTTVVTIKLDAEVSKAYFEVERVREGAPREVLKIRGVNSPYSPKEMAVGTEQVLRLRTGLHQGPDGSALHVVADLASPAVTILSVEPKGRDLEITFS